MTIAPEGRRLLRLEVRNASTPIEKKPSWIRTTARMGPEYRELYDLVKSQGLHTVCQEAGCPNIFECWEDREATFLIGGDVCTRRCDFCQIDTGKPATFDASEPVRVAESHPSAARATTPGNDRGLSESRPSPKATESADRGSPITSRRLAPLGYERTEQATEGTHGASGPSRRQPSTRSDRQEVTTASGRICAREATATRIGGTGDKAGGRRRS